MKDAREKLIDLLQKAYSGELAAALAYNGHWKSLKDETEIEIVKKIEQDEWLHRAKVGEMLFDLDAKPKVLRDKIFYLIGRSVGIICHFCGRFCSAFFAGILESKNVDEYRQALIYAKEIGLEKYFEDFIEMRKTEAEHEFVLREMIKDDWFFPVFSFVFRWGKKSDFVYQRQNARF